MTPPSRPARSARNGPRRLGLPAGIPIAIGEFDVHYGAIGCGVTEGTLVKVIGTSTCDCGVVSADKQVPDIPGICGIVKGAILPGYYGIEAGQSAVGDIFKWWVEVVCEGDAALHARLSREAARLKPGQSGLLALDWNNGNRTILVDQTLSGLLLGQTLHTTRAEIYRALIEATAFGARAIIERIKEYGVPIDRVVCAGGIAEKNPLLMQIYADVTGCTMLVAGSSQACALGSGRLGGGARRRPPGFRGRPEGDDLDQAEAIHADAAARKIYDQLYVLYRQLHDSFGGLEQIRRSVPRDEGTARDQGRPKRVGRNRWARRDWPLPLTTRHPPLATSPMKLLANPRNLVCHRQPAPLRPRPAQAGRCQLHQDRPAPWPPRSAFR